MDPIDTRLLATRSIEARARQEGRASLYDWIVYKRGSKAREKKREERKHRSKLYTVLWSRDSDLPLRDGKLRQSAVFCPLSAIFCQRRNN